MILCLLNNTCWTKIVFKTFVVICWKIRIFAYWTTPFSPSSTLTSRLWFAEKFVSLLIEQHRTGNAMTDVTSCDLLKNSYLCLLNNTLMPRLSCSLSVVICWKIRIFAYWTTPTKNEHATNSPLWFAEKFVSLLIEQHPAFTASLLQDSCDLLKNSYLCLLNNTKMDENKRRNGVVICWKIRIFAYWTTPARWCRPWRRWLWFAEKFVSLLIEQHQMTSPNMTIGSCDLLKNSYLCLLNNTWFRRNRRLALLWFAEKFVSLLIEQHPTLGTLFDTISCDLLKNSYLCLLNNTSVIQP